MIPAEPLSGPATGPDGVPDVAAAANSSPCKSSADAMAGLGDGPLAASAAGLAEIIGRPLRGSPLAIIFVTVFIDLLGFGMIIPAIPYYASHYGAGGLTVGMLFTSYSLMQFLFAPAWGRVSDRVGRRPILMIGLAGSCISYLIFGMARSLGVLFASRIMAGIAGANIPTAQAYVADATPPSDRTRGMGVIGAAFGLGFVFGPAIGGTLSHFFGYSAPPYFASALSAIAFTVALGWLPESIATGRPRVSAGRAFSPTRLWRVLTRPRIGVLLVIFFLTTFSLSNLEVTMALFVQRRFGWSLPAYMYLITYTGLVMALVQGMLVGRLAGRFGERRLVMAGTLAVTLGLLFLPAATGGALLVVDLAVFAVGIGINNPSVASLITLASGSEEQGGVLGVSQSVSSLSRILGPAWGGFTYDRLGIAYPYITGAAFMAVAFVLSLGLAGTRTQDRGLRTEDQTGARGFE